MGWPKGKPRKGYVRKDGQPAQPAGRKSRHPAIALKDTGTKREKTRTARSNESSPVSTTPTTTSKRVSSRRPQSSQSDTAQTETRAPRAKYSTKLIHSAYVIEPCPDCGFPEADGGYCPDCGWSAPMPELLPANTVHGRPFKK